jgi:hypothetical protein
VKQVISFVFVAVVTALIAAPASGQVAAGLNEIGGRGYVETGKYPTFDRETVVSVDMFYGRFLTDRFEIGPGLSLYKYGDEPTTGAINAFADYHLGDTTSRVRPYVGAGVGKFLTGGDSKPLFIAAGPGVKLFFGEGGGAVTAAVFYRRQFMDADLNDGASGSNDFVLSIGVSGFFGR